MDEAEFEWPKVECEDCYREFDYELLRVFQGAAREFMLCPACHRKYSEQRAAQAVRSQRLSDAG